MKLKSILFLLLLNSYYLVAQNGIITGKVIDSKSKSPLSFVNIILKEKGKTVGGGVTFDNGSFSIKGLELKNYDVDIQYIGYKTIHKQVSLSTENRVQSLGVIALEEEAAKLQEVEIVKEKSTIEQKIDRKVINVGKDLISAGATAGEILNNIPSVAVDPQTNAISLRGNENVRVLVDGKPTNVDVAQLLKQIPSASIKQVELITNPSAKYNPEGMSGIINIVLNKNASKGFNGSVNNGVTFGKTPKINSSIDLNYKVGKVNLYGNYGFNHGYQANHGYINNYNPTKKSNADFNFRNKNTSHLYKVGVDYFINDMNTISFYTTQNDFRATGTSLNAVDYFDNLLNTDQIQSQDSKNKNQSQTYNLDYKHLFNKEGENIELEVNYNQNNGKELSFFNTYIDAFSDSFSNNVSSLNKNTKANLDYTKPFKDNSKLELGAETRIENTSNGFDKNATYNSDFYYERNINSLYATYGKQWTKWGMQVGARFENYTAKATFKSVDTTDENNNGNTTEVITKPFSDVINTVYPSGYISYKLNDKNTFSFNYSRRVDRPGIGQVNPIREWSTPTVTSVGNPYLVPQFTNSFEFSYSTRTKIGTVNTVVFYRNLTDEITRVVEIDPNDATKNILSYTNFKNNNSYGAEISSNLDFTKWWSANVSADIYFRTIRGTVSNNFVEKQAQVFNTRINNTFKANKNLRFQWFAMYRGNERSLQMDRKYMFRTDIGASLNVLKGKGTLSARYSDIFKTMHYRFVGDLPYNQEGAFYWESNTLYIGFNYRFGGGKNAALQRKQRDKNETQGSGGIM